jgi:hypothetical protein
MFICVDLACLGKNLSSLILHGGGAGRVWLANEFRVELPALGIKVELKWMERRWCHICFYIILRTQITNTDTLETKTKANIIGNRYRPNTHRMRSYADVGGNKNNPWSMQQKNSSIQTNQQTCFLILWVELDSLGNRGMVRPVKTSSNGWRGYMVASFGMICFGSSAWQSHGMWLLDSVCVSVPLENVVPFFCFCQSNFISVLQNSIFISLFCSCFSA